MTFPGFGGGILIAGCRALYILNSEIASNRASFGGGGGLSVHFVQRCDIQGVVFSNNAAINGSGLLLSTENQFDPLFVPPWIDPLYKNPDIFSILGEIKLFVEGSKFIDNIASDCGGGFILQAKSVVNLTLAEFRGNFAVRGAGFSAVDDVEVTHESYENAVSYCK